MNASSILALQSLLGGMAMALGRTVRMPGAAAAAVSADDSDTTPGDAMPSGEACAGLVAAWQGALAQHEPAVPATPAGALAPEPTATVRTEALQAAATPAAPQPLAATPATMHWSVELQQGPHAGWRLDGVRMDGTPLALTLVLPPGAPERLTSQLPHLHSRLLRRGHEVGSLSARHRDDEERG